MKKIVIKDCSECYHLITYDSAYFCDKAEKEMPFSAFDDEHKFPEWCPLEDDK